MTRPICSTCDDTGEVSLEHLGWIPCSDCADRPKPPPPPRVVIIESPYAGNVERNLRYLRACMRDSLRRNEAPYASHGLYTQPGVLDDTMPEERKLGMEAGFAFRPLAAATVVYEDLGLSSGMKAGILDAEKHGRPIERRRLGGEWAEPATSAWVGLLGLPPVNSMVRLRSNGLAPAIAIHRSNEWEVSHLLSEEERWMLQRPSGVRVVGADTRTGTHGMFTVAFLKAHFDFFVTNNNEWEVLRRTPEGVSR